jgi:hypothetical protein
LTTHDQQPTQQTWPANLNILYPDQHPPIAMGLSTCASPLFAASRSGGALEPIQLSVALLVSFQTAKLDISSHAPFALVYCDTSSERTICGMAVCSPSAFHERGNAVSYKLQAKHRVIHKFRPVSCRTTRARGPFCLRSHHWPDPALRFNGANAVNKLNGAFPWTRLGPFLHLVLKLGNQTCCAC